MKRNKISQRLLLFLGVSKGDMADVEKHNSVYSYMLSSAISSFLRILANHCIIPSLRIRLFRASGIQIGQRAQVNLNVYFIDGFQKGLVILEDEVSVAPGVTFVASSHPNNSPLQTKYRIGKTDKIHVKKGAWIGTGAVINPGVVIGMCSIIGANAVVTKNVEDYAIMYGIPASKRGDVRDKKVNDDD